VANTDNTFTKVPNALYDAMLAQKLSITQERALLYIIRKTYGFHKADDRISISKMAEDTGFTRRAMINAVHDLEKMGVIKLGSKRNGLAYYMNVQDPKLWDADL